MVFKQIAQVLTILLPHGLTTPQPHGDFQLAWIGSLEQLVLAAPPLPHLPHPHLAAAPTGSDILRTSTPSAMERQGPRRVGIRGAVPIVILSTLANSILHVRRRPRPSLSTLAVSVGTHLPPPPRLAVPRLRSVLLLHLLLLHLLLPLQPLLHLLLLHLLLPLQPLHHLLLQL